MAVCTFVFARESCRAYNAKRACSLLYIGVKFISMTCICEQIGNNMF